MTKERRLAIQMWRKIREIVRRRGRLIPSWELHLIKKEFCEEHGIKWWHNCWFCQYLRNNKEAHGEGCQYCPLADKTDDAVMSGSNTGCGQGFYHDVLMGDTVTIRVAACNKIIQALQGKDPYEED